MRWRCVPSPTKDEPERIGFPQVVPRHITVPPQWIGGWPGCICARTAEWMPSAPIEQRAARLRRRAVGVLDQRANAAVAELAIAGDPAAELDRLRPDPLHDLIVQQHVEPPAMHRVLRPVVAGEFSARLGIDVVAVEPDQRPFLCGQADLVEVRLGDAEVVKLAHGVRLQVDADAERAHLAHRFEDGARHADLMQRERGGEPADAAAGDDHAIIGHCHHASSPQLTRSLGAGRDSPACRQDSNIVRGAIPFVPSRGDGLRVC